MKQRCDLVAFALLVFACVFLVAIVQSPKEFKISDWQPLMAAALTLVGAGIVYRGAILAYRAAMSKVEHDRSVHTEQARRRIRGIYLRTGFAVYVIAKDAGALMSECTSPSEKSPNKYFTRDELQFRTITDVSEVWKDLDVFPQKIATSLFDLQVGILDFENSKDRLPEGRFIQSRKPRAQAEDDMLWALNNIAKVAMELSETLAKRSQELDP